MVWGIHNKNTIMDEWKGLGAHTRYVLTESEYQEYQGLKHDYPIVKEESGLWYDKYLEVYREMADLKKFKADCDKDIEEWDKGIEVSYSRQWIDALEVLEKRNCYIDGCYYGHISNDYCVCCGKKRPTPNHYRGKGLCDQETLEDIITIEHKNNNALCWDEIELLEDKVEDELGEIRTDIEDLWERVNDLNQPVSDFYQFKSTQKLINKVIEEILNERDLDNMAKGKEDVRSERQDQRGSLWWVTPGQTYTCDIQGMAEAERKPRAKRSKDSKESVG